MLAALLLSAPLLAAPLAPDASDEPPAVATERRGTGVGLGMHMGMWGREYGSGLRLDVPVHELAGVRLRTTTQYANTMPDGEPGYMPTNGAGLELFVRTPVLSDRYRLSAGGGLLAAIDGTHQPALGAGGHVGVETFVSRRTAFSVELGGQGGPGALDAADGFSAMVGMSVYLGKL